MATKKEYAEAEKYEVKLEKVMQRLGVKKYDYDWSRFKCWVEFQYKGAPYRFEHSIENAQTHGNNIKYGSDVFAQVVLTLEDLARMVERGIYDLSTYIAGMKMLPASIDIPKCFIALGFSTIPETIEVVKKKYKQLCKAVHPDSGGSDTDFVNLTENYNACLSQMEGDS